MAVSFEGLALGFPKTDLGNAERFAAEHNDDARYCHATKTWLVWTGERWHNDPVRLYQMAKETVRNLYREASEIESDAERRGWMEFALSCESAHRIHAMLELAQNESGIPIAESDLDSDPMLFNALNGTLDLRTGELHEHRREDFITKIAPVAYSPNARCPQWLDFLGDVTAGNPGLAAYLQRAVGYTLTGKVNEHAMFFLYGTGANGKTTFLETIRKVFGDYSECTPFDTLMVQQASPRNDLVKLRGARFITAVENEDGKRLAESVVKRLTGGDKIAARALYHEFTSFAMEGKIWLGMNHRPTVRGTDIGIWRRIKLIPFTVCIPEERRDLELPEKLAGEAGGILAWAVEGCQEYQRKGLDSPECVTAATQNYREDQDVIGRFLDACCEKAATAMVPTRDVYNGFKVWAKENGEDFEISEKKFSQLVAEKGFEKTQHGQTRRALWFGLKLNDGKPAPKPN